MHTFKIRLTAPRPYFAEMPYALWGETNYDSEGDCKRPTDQEWREMELMNRKTREGISIISEGDLFEVSSESRELAARATTFLLERSGGVPEGDDPRQYCGEWKYDDAYAGTARIRAEFPRKELAPFDSHYFWGSWKWTGWFATEFTWVGRWIMHSLLYRDTRAVYLCIYWLKQGTAHPDQNRALRHALNILTGKNYETDIEWLKWYEGGFLRKGGKALYPEPDIDAWLEDLKREN